MALTIGGVVCEELVAEQLEEFDILAGPTQMKGFLCPWANRFQVAQGLLGLSTTTHIGGLITLNNPFQYPEMATSYASHVAIKGVGPPTQGPIQFAFTKAKLVVTFSCHPWSFAGLSSNDFANQIDPTHPYIYAEQNLDFGSEWITVPGKSVYWKSSGLPLGPDTPWGFRSPIVHMRISIKYIPYIPAAAILSASAAPINSTPYLGCAAGFLLFGGAPTQQARMSDGSLTQSADYTFSYRPIAPWDYTYNGALPGWDQVVDSTGANIQKRSDISTVIPAYYNM